MGYGGEQWTHLEVQCPPWSGEVRFFQSQERAERQVEASHAKKVGTKILNNAMYESSKSQMMLKKVEAVKKQNTNSLGLLRKMQGYKMTGTHRWGDGR